MSVYFGMNEYNENRIRFISLMNMPSFHNTPGSFFNGMGKNESLRIRFTHQVFQFAKFKSGNYRKYDIHIGMDMELTRQKSPFPFVNRDTPSQFIHQPVF